MYLCSRRRNLKGTAALRPPATHCMSHSWRGWSSGTATGFASLNVLKKFHVSHQALLRQCLATYDHILLFGFNTQQHMALFTGEKPGAVSAVSGHHVTLPPRTEDDAELPQQRPRATHYERGDKNFVFNACHASLLCTCFVFSWRICRPSDSVPCVCQSQRSERVRGTRPFPGSETACSVLSASPSEQALHCDRALWAHQVSAPAGNQPLTSRTLQSMNPKDPNNI